MTGAEAQDRKLSYHKDKERQGSEQTILIKSNTTNPTCSTYKLGELRNDWYSQDGRIAEVR